MSECTACRNENLFPGMICQKCYSDLFRKCEGLEKELHDVKKELHARDVTIKELKKELYQAQQGSLI